VTPTLTRKDLERMPRVKAIAEKKDRARITLDWDSLTLTLRLKITSEANARNHWAARAGRVKEQRQAVHRRLCKEGVPVGPWTVTLTRIAPRDLDGDNLQAAFKAARDGVADALGLNDRDPRIAWLYRQERGQIREYAVRIRIESRGDDHDQAGGGGT